MLNVKEAILQAAEIAGNKLAKEAKEDPNGLISYLQWAAVEHPRAYLALLERIMRSQPDQADPPQSVEELQNLLRERGLPERIFTHTFEKKTRPGDLTSRAVSPRPFTGDQTNEAQPRLPPRQRDPRRRSHLLPDADGSRSHA